MSDFPSSPRLFPLQDPPLYSFKTAIASFKTAIAFLALILLLLHVLLFFFFPLYSFSFIFPFFFVMSVSALSRSLARHTRPAGSLSLRNFLAPRTSYSTVTTPSQSAVSLKDAFDTPSPQ